MPQLNIGICDAVDLTTQTSQLLLHCKQCNFILSITAMCLLQDNVPAFPSAQAIEIVERNLGGPVTEKFESFNQEPIAAASLGQVPAPFLEPLVHLGLTTMWSCVPGQHTGSSCYMSLEAAK